MRSYYFPRQPKIKIQIEHQRLWIINQTHACSNSLDSVGVAYGFLSIASPPAHLHRVHPCSHSCEGRGLGYVIHGKDSVGFAVVLLSYAAKPKQD